MGKVEKLFMLEKQNQLLQWVVLLERRAMSVPQGATRALQYSLSLPARWLLSECDLGHRQARSLLCFSFAQWQMLQGSPNGQMWWAAARRGTGQGGAVSRPIYCQNSPRAFKQQRAQLLIKRKIRKNRRTVLGFPYSDFFPYSYQVEKMHHKLWNEA